LLTSRIATHAVDQTRWRTTVNGLGSHALLLDVTTSA
jgi:hypothetical protein